MVLGAEDLAAEQEYFLERQRRHNRYVHGWGVVSGLSVSIVDDEVIVEAGMAIDCAGNEIFLESQVKCDLPVGASIVYVAIEYFETDVDPVPELNHDAAGQAPISHSRILEGARVRVLDCDPGANHDGMGAGSPGCNRRHPIPIARVALGPGKTEILSCGRR